jgi:hypothetical protein
MSKVVRIQDGDYSVITRNANVDTTITLDSNSVVITGNLDVKGVTTQIESVNTTVKDNIIVLNQGELGAGVTLQKSGITIDRGQASSVNLLFDETITWTTPSGFSQSGAFTLIRNDSTLVALKTNVITTGTGTLRINTGVTGTGTISVSGTPDYEDRVLDDDDIPNYKFLKNYILSNYVPGGGQGLAVVDQFYRYNGNTKLDTGAQAYDSALDGTSRVEIKVDGTVQAYVNTSGLITNYVSSNTGNLTLTAASGLVDVTANLGLQNQGSAPSAVAGKNIIYSSSTQSTGATGVYFKNSTTNGELISSKKALLYAIIF